MHSTPAPTDPVVPLLNRVSPPGDKTRRRVVWAAAAAALIGGFAWGESAGWPMLGGPVAHLLSQRLGRHIGFDDGTASSLRVRLLGSLRLSAAKMTVAAPEWSLLGPTLVADDVAVQLHYGDLIAFKKGRPLNIQRLAARHTALEIERLEDGRASWQFGAGANEPRDTDKPPVFDGLHVDELALTEGSARVRDAHQRVDLQLAFSLREAALTDSASLAPQPSRAPPAVLGASAAAALVGLELTATGSFRELPVKARLVTGSASGWLSSAANAPSVTTQLALTVGKTHLQFDGTLTSPLGSPALEGRYALRGPSLFAVGEPVGLTLPTTAPFRMEGDIDHAGAGWHTVVRQARIGESRLAGEFVFVPAGAQPASLTGRLSGESLKLADLGPAVGVPTPEVPGPKPTSGKVLPQRAFNLPSLRAMNADVDVALARVDLGTPELADIQPLKARLRLKDGVLVLQDIDARVAKGALSGQVTLDGRKDTAQWQSRLQLKDLKLEDWIRQTRAAGLPPYVSGRLAIQLALDGQGRSTAQLLGSANGRVLMHWSEGSISHLLVEAAGIDVAQGLGVLIRGDDALPVQCGAADLDLRKGVLTPRVMLIDSKDSTLRLTGSLSLADERLALVARVAPKDFSPLSLRSPVHVDGSLSRPVVSIEKTGLLKRLLPAAALATVSPLAALLPLLDLGDDEVKAAIEACRSVAARSRAGLFSDQNRPGAGKLPAKAVSPSGP